MGKTAFSPFLITCDVLFLLIMPGIFHLSSKRHLGSDRSPLKIAMSLNPSISNSLRRQHTLILGNRQDDVERIIYELRRAGFDPRIQHADSEAAYRKLLPPVPDIILASPV